MKQPAFSPHRVQLEQVIAHFNLPRSSLEIVDSIREYCAEIGAPHLESSDTRIAKCITSNACVPTFLLWDHADASDAMMPMIIRGFPDQEIRLLNDPAAFAMHQLLHEIAHFQRSDIHENLDHGDVERDCDQWAFEQLKSLPSQLSQRSMALRRSERRPR